MVGRRGGKVGVGGSQSGGHGHKIIQFVHTSIHVVTMARSNDRSNIVWIPRF